MRGCLAPWAALLSTQRGAARLAPRMAERVALFTSEVCLRHEPGWMHPERPERLARLLHAMRTSWAAEFSGLLRVHEEETDATEEQLLRVHTLPHLRRLDAAFDRAEGFLTPRVSLDSDTAVSAGSRAAALRAAGLVVAAVDLVVQPTAPRRAFVMVRPPGHHAEPERAMGFCLYNNVLVGVAHAQAVHGVGRVAVLDFDVRGRDLGRACRAGSLGPSPQVHHGNGGAAMCWADPTRLYASSHQSEIFPCGASAYSSSKTGRAGLHGQVLSSALPAGAGSAEFRHAWAEQILPQVREFQPEAIFLSAGFDAHAEDELASLSLYDDDYEWITLEIGKLGDGSIPIVSVLEGGYDLDALTRCTRAHLKGLIHS